MITDVIGIDCSTDPKNVGLARFDGQRRAVVATHCGGTSPLEVLEGWISEARRVVLAFDAPLGWPAAFVELANHLAGDRVSTPRGETFNRLTDRFIGSEVGQPALRVGADRIAMTAHWALELLDDLRSRTSQPIPLAWHPDFGERVAAIEVYPAATLRSAGFRCAAYKRAVETHQEGRASIVRDLAMEMEFSEVAAGALLDADVLDAIVCCLAGRDFLEGRCHPPVDRAVSRKEGWIWVRRTSNKTRVM